MIYNCLSIETELKRNYPVQCKLKVLLNYKFQKNNTFTHSMLKSPVYVHNLYYIRSTIKIVISHNVHVCTCLPSF